MHHRFSRLRSVLHSQWQSAKQEGRSHEKMMTAFYEQDVAESEEAIRSLQASIDLSRRNVRDLQQLIYGTSQTTESLASTRKNIESGLTDRLTQATLDLNRLKVDEETLRQTLKKRNDDMNELESSSRAILRASWRLTKQRARRVRKLILRR